MLLLSPARLAPHTKYCNRPMLSDVTSQRPNSSCLLPHTPEQLLLSHVSFDTAMAKQRLRQNTARKPGTQMLEPNGLSQNGYGKNGNG